MKKLASDRFLAATQFIAQNARHLDRALFAYEFESGSATAVLDALAAFQNADGGFGHGIEPDFRTPASTPMATSVGLQYCVDVGAEADAPIVQRAIAYLLATYDHEHGYWPKGNTAVNDAPHAPWWHVDDLTPPSEDDWPNVSAELAGYLFAYPSLVPADFLETLRERLTRNLAATDTLGWLYHVLCWQRAAPFLPDALAATAVAKIERTFAALHPLTAEKLQEVSILWLAPTPQSILEQQYPDVVKTLIDQAIADQADDGGWWPTWQWGQYEDVWPVAEREWAGKKTSEALKALRAYGRIAH